MLDDAPDIQVYIPVYNGMPYLKDAVASVLSQTGVDFQLIVSDNCSTDGTWPFLQDLSARDRRVKIHRNETNIGMFPNLDLVRNYVTADAYTLLCADDVLSVDDALDRALQILKSDTGIVSVYCDHAFIDRHGKVMLNHDFPQRGIFSAPDALRSSVIQHRNLFGIPLLHRTSAAFSVPYSTKFPYSADLVHSAEVGLLGKLARIDGHLIGNRYTGQNATAGLLSGAAREFRSLRQHFSLKLSPMERAQFEMSSLFVSLKKWIFLKWASLR
ncbi:glycosyltransferase family 2 protein [Ahrensia sp. R2A130]|uniref:glycosyltransferase family 2 protein n=1 Tax=Ahrensia sp. R2A130 TaxID=744979 RepID=UPI0001E0B4F1|nr:glycosyltransferase family 2 protein [Ahrensia sp. R2A130]EFL88477.1 glycosyl transferase family protein [Ahrensia sp. R2A130]